MSFDSFLSQTCSISRPKPIGLDRYNNAKKMPRVVSTNVRCRKTQKTMRLLDQASSEYAYVKADLVLFPAGTDVQVKDQITIDAQVWVVTQLLGRQGASSMHHFSAIVEALNAQAQP